MAMIHVFLVVLFLQVCAAEKPRNETDNHRAFPVKNDVIAFSAELSDDVDLSPGATLVFDRTITNVGGLYYNTTGQFVCPDGLYVFIWNIVRGSGGSDGVRGICMLRRGGVDEKYGPKTSYYTSIYFSGVSEMTAILECSSNPLAAVTVTSQPWEGSSISRFVSPFTSFTGFNLQAGVAFTAELSQDQSLFQGGRIMFDRVLANHGDYYDVTNGRFRCPDAGVYVFMVTTHTPDPSTPWSVSRLIVDREVVMQGPITFIATEDYDSGSASTTAVLQCIPDYSVYVEAQAAHDFPHNSYGAELTSFTGFKLYDVTPDTIAFTVVMSQNFTSAMSRDPIPFDEVITNIGSAFEISNNRFVCPDDAYYMFTWTGVAPTVRGFMDLLMDESRVKQHLTTHKGNSIDTMTGTSGSCSQAVILQCQPASVLQVVSRNSADHFLGGYTSFSGYKLPG